MALIVLLTLLFFIFLHPARFKISRLAITSYCFIFSLENRARAQKQGLYRRLCARLDDEMAVSPQDVMVVIQFNQLEDWSFSAGRWRMNETGGAAEAPRFR